LVANFGSALGALVQVEGELGEAQLAEGVLAVGGDRMHEIIFAQQAKDSDVIQSLWLFDFLLFFYLLRHLLSLLLFLDLLYYRHLLLHDNIL
jgi:hypothetical protein